MRERFVGLIAREAEYAAEGRPARIVAKMNSLVDSETIRALYRASQAGVEIDLIVRGICCLRPGLPGISDRISVVSVVGRFLEHSRLWYFANGGREEFYLGSADWMPRNFDRRVEVVTPVTDARLHPRLHSLLIAYLLDDRHAWDLLPDGRYRQRRPDEDGVEHGSHEAFLSDSWGMPPYADGSPRLSQVRGARPGSRAEEAGARETLHAPGAARPETTPGA